MTRSIDDKVEYYYQKFVKEGKNYSKDKLEEALEYLSYKHVDVMPKTESEAEPTLYIFRHGQTEDNANFVFSGWRDSPLTQKGKEQALILADKLKDKKMHMLVSSPQIRAIDTMVLAVSKNAGAKNLEIQKDERIKERSYGNLQGKNKLEIYMENKEILEEIRRSFDHTVPNGESIKMVCERVADFCDEIVPLMKKHNISVAVSCHGNSIRGFRRYFEKLDDYTTAHLETPLGQDYLAYVID